jgi:WD40 repeat protein/serine/threonine protein kinase
MDDSSGDRNPVEMLAEDFLDRQRRGEKPTLREYCERNPDLADEIRLVFPALCMVEDLKPEAGQITGELRREAAKLERIGDYRLIREVGRGGMGIVYEAEQESLGRHVALKLLPSSALLDQRQLARFQRESKAAARLHHTNIVPVYGVGTHDGTHYYVMQFIQGLGLDEVLEELRRLREGKSGTTKVGRTADASLVAHGLVTGEFRNSVAAADGMPEHTPTNGEPRTNQGAAPPSATGFPNAGSASSSSIRLPGQSGASSFSESGRQYWHSVARIGMQVADALAYANSQGTLHRDIKPANLLLDTQGNVWVTDFGLAKAIVDQDNLTHTGDIVGTLRYMAPERFHGHGDARSDIYSLGLTLYEMATLRPAFDERHREKLVQQVMHDEPPPPRKLNKAIPQDLETIILKAIARESSRRYATATELAEDLRRFVEDKPIQARRVTLRERFARWCRRNPALAASLGLAAAALLAVAVVSVLFARSEAENSANLAKANEDLGRVNDNLVTEQAKTAKALKASQEQAAINRRQLARMSVDQATKRMDDGDLYSALVLSTHALQLDAGDPARETIHRQRIASILQQCPRPVKVWNYADVVRAELSRDGKYVLIVSLDERPAAGKWLEAPRRVQVWELATGKEIAPWTAFGDDVLIAIFSPDGRRVFTVRGDRSKIVVSGQTPLLSADFEVWDLATQKRIGPPIKTAPGTFFRGTTSAMESLFSIAVPSKEPGGPRHAELAVWETATGKKRLGWSIELLPERPPGFGHFIAFFDPTGKHAVTVGPTLQLWDATTGKLRKTLDGKEFSNKASEAVFSSDARFVLVYGHGGRIYRTDTGERIGKELFNRDANITSAAFGPDGKLIATASHDHTARIWDAATGEPVTAPLVHDAQVVHVSFSADGRRIVTACNGGGAWIWDVAGGKQEGARLPHAGLVKRAEFSPDGRHVLTSGSDGAVKLWDLATIESRGRLLGTQGRHGRFSPDGRTLATVTWSGHLQLWDSATGKRIGDPLAKWGPRMATGLAFSPEGKVLASGSPDAAAIRVWDVDKHALLRELQTRGQVSFLAFSADGRRLVANCELPDKDRKPRATHELTVWDMTDLQTATPLIRIVNAPRWYELAVSADARLAAFYDREGPAVYDLTTGRRQTALLPNVGIRHFAFSPGGEAVAAGDDLTVRVWNSRTGELLWQRDHAGWVHTVDFSHDGGRLLSTSYDGTARIWSAKTGDPLVVLSHRAPVNGAYFSRDGRLVVTLSGDETARVWEAATGHPVTPPLRHNGNLQWDAGFSPDASRLFTASYTSTPQTDYLWLWDLSQQTQPLPSLKRLASTLAARELSGDGLLLHHSASAEAWQELRRDWPEGFRTTKAQELDWHTREARACEAVGLWSTTALQWRRIVELEPKNAFHQYYLARALAGSGQIQAAISSYMAAAEGLPTWRSTVLCYAAVLHLANDDHAAYRQVCAKLFDEYKDTDNADYCNGLCWAMCFVPDAHPELRSLADRAVKLLTKDPANHNRVHTAACFLYRAGRDDEALKWLQVSMKADPSGEGYSYDWIFLAMVHSRQGRPKEARKWLDKTKADIASKEKVRPAVDPIFRIQLELLIREAEAVLADRPKAKGASKRKGD